MATNNITYILDVGSSPVGIAVSPDGTKVYVANYDDNTTSVINTSTNSVIATVPVGTGPNKIAIGNVNPLPAKPESVVDFTSNVTEGYVPLSVQFTDFSKNATVWYWDLGDGTFSTEQYPIHVYSTAGTYNVNLTINNENGTFSKTAQINVLEERRSSGGSSSHNSGGSKLKSLNSSQTSSTVNNSTNNITESANITKPQDTIDEVEQANESSTENEALTPEQISTPSTSESINAKASGFGILFGICCLAAIFLLYKRK